MVSLDELVKSEQAPPLCTVRTWLESLPEDVQQSFARHIEQGTATAQLHRACRKLDPPVPVAYQMFRRHINGACQCPP